ncbi:unnamed protein product [Phyllotreta striolata]|uniref:Endothelin-converting enzyme 1 n=1 Tax=Phyllotreta striolata TaxID=444603 RepID=A0A9N9TV76_PHYSR|nr:unnamed protein product [Phyllotreta striolata]
MDKCGVMINGLANSSRMVHKNYLVGIKSRANIFKNTSHLRKLSICTLILAIIFFIIMVIFISLYLNKKSKLCTSIECLRAASNYLSSMNSSVDPCDNFYEFVCGRWSNEHPNHGWWSSFSSFTTISEKIAITARNALTNPPDASEPEAVRKSKNFYTSCIDSETIDNLGLTTIYPYLGKLNLPIVPSLLNASNSSAVKFDWLRTDALAKQYLLMDLFIGATVGPNIFNGSQNVLYVGKIYQTTPLPSPLKKSQKPLNKRDTNQELKRTVRSNIIKYLIGQVVFNTTGTTPAANLLENAADVIMDISDFVDEIVSNTTDPFEEEDETYSIPIRKLQQEIAGKQPKNFLIDYFNELFNRTNVTINPDSDLVYVTDADVTYLKTVVNYLSETPDVEVELYTWWTSVYAMIFSTSDNFTEHIKKELNSYARDQEKIVRSRSLECALLTNNYMGYAVSYALADRSFASDTKPKVEIMIEEIKNAFVAHVKGIRWMDGKTKRATLEKTKEMLTFVGYPDWLFQKGKLDEHYSDYVIEPGRFLDNMVSVINSHAIDNLNSLRKTHKRDWYTEPTEVNAFNSFSDNAINVPFAILNFPLYNLGLEALNYGAIGSILGHEIIHGFDNIGRKHDKYGNFIQWWTNQTIESFEDLTDCFVKQYDNFTIKEVGEVNGRATLGENLADNGGLNQAYKAYVNYVRKNGEEPRLPGFQKYNNYQMFFIAYSSIWCETINASDLEDQLEYDEHCPNFIRVLGSLQNSEDFSREFHCPKGSPMNPDVKCKIW